MKTFSLVLFYAITISIEKWFGYLIPIPFARSTNDLNKNKHKLINPLKKSLPVREIQSFHIHSVIGNELGKDQYVTGVILSYLDHEHHSKELSLVIKYLSEREEPLLISALNSAIYRGLNREVKFYQELSTDIPFRTPKCIYADSIPLLYRGIIVLEKLDPDLIVDDYVGCKLKQSEAVVRNISLMHAKFWDRTDQISSSQWLPDKHPLDVLWFLKYFTKKEKACHLLWKALYSYFKDHPLTVTHGDCRPGNIMWYDDGSIAMLDWQFIHAGIGTWDLAYFTVMAHESDLRREIEESLLSLYYSDLSGSYRKMHSKNLLYTAEQCAQDFHILKLVVGLYGWAALISRMFDKYGNDHRDVRSWADRITSAITDLDSNFVSKTINISSWVIDDFKSVMCKASELTKERFVDNAGQS